MEGCELCDPILALASLLGPFSPREVGENLVAVSPEQPGLVASSSLSNLVGNYGIVLPPLGPGRESFR